MKIDPTSRKLWARLINENMASCEWENKIPKILGPHQSVYEKQVFPLIESHFLGFWKREVVKPPSSNLNYPPQL